VLITIVIISITIVIVVVIAVVIISVTIVIVVVITIVIIISITIVIVVLITIVIISITIVIVVVIAVVIISITIVIVVIIAVVIISVTIVIVVVITIVILVVITVVIMVMVVTLVVVIVHIVIFHVIGRFQVVFIELVIVDDVVVVVFVFVVFIFLLVVSRSGFLLLGLVIFFGRFIFSVLLRGLIISLLRGSLGLLVFINFNTDRLEDVFALSHSVHNNPLRSSMSVRPLLSANMALLKDGILKLRILVVLHINLALSCVLVELADLLIGSIDSRIRESILSIREAVVRLLFLFNGSLSDVSAFLGEVAPFALARQQSVRQFRQVIVGGDGVREGVVVDIKQLSDLFRGEQLAPGELPVVGHHFGDVNRVLGAGDALVDQSLAVRPEVPEPVDVGVDEVEDGVAGGHHGAHVASEEVVHGSVGSTLDVGTEARGGTVGGGGGDDIDGSGLTHEEDGFIELPLDASIVEISPPSERAGLDATRGQPTKV